MAKSQTKIPVHPVDEQLAPLRLIPLVAGNFFKQLPAVLHPLLESGILLAALMAVILNAFFNGLGSNESARKSAASGAAAAEHV